MFVQDHHSLEELQRLARAPGQERISLRHRAVVLAKQGRSAQDIARTLGCSRRAVQAWIARYNRDGLHGLRESPHTGRPPRLSGPDVLRFRERLAAGPKPEDGTRTLRGRDARRILRDEFGVTLGRQAVYDLIHRLGYRGPMSRRRHEQAAPEDRGALRRGRRRADPRRRRGSPREDDPHVPAG